MSGYHGKNETGRDILKPTGLKMTGAALLLGSVLLLCSCLGWLIEKPTFILKEITIRPVSLTELHFLLGVEARNPNGFDLEVKSLDFKLLLNDREIGNGLLQKEILIRKSSTSDIRIPIAATYTNIAEYLKTAFKGGEIRYKLVGNARIKAGLGSTRIPFSTEGTINPKK